MPDAVDDLWKGMHTENYEKYDPDGRRVSYFTT